jgi:hypothetical protein
MAALAALALAGSTQVAAEKPDAATQALLDKVAIVDLLSRYYGNFSNAGSESFMDYYTDDGVFDVNGHVAHGKKRSRASTRASPPPAKARRRGAPSTC